MNIFDDRFDKFMAVFIIWPIGLALGVALGIQKLRGQAWKVTKKPQDRK